MKKLLIVGLCLLVLCSCGQLEQTNKPQETKQEITIESETPQVSDDLDTRFRQIFHKEFSKDSRARLPLRKYETVSVPSGRFYDSHKDEAGRLKGAFYFVEPTYSILSKGIDEAVLRGMYDIGYEELEDEYRYTSFTIQYESEDAILRDLVLTSSVSSFLPQEQKIPLVQEGNTWTAQFDAVKDILDYDVTYGHSFSLEGVLEYKGQSYPFKDIRF